jgi:hypothetical protein
MPDTTTTTPATPATPATPPVDKAVLKEKMRVKVDEMFSVKQGDKETDPVIVERVNQIVNDAIAGMPEKPIQLSTEKPEEAMMKKLKKDVERMTASIQPPELADKIKGIPSAIEAAIAEGDKPVIPAAPGPANTVPTAPPAPEHQLQPYSAA